MAHTFDVKAQSALGTANPTTLSLTPTSGATVLVAIILISGITDRTGGSPTWNGVAMTKAGATIKSPVEGSVEIWYMLDPAIGTFNVSVPNSNTRSLEVVACSFKAAAGNTTTFDTTGSATNTSTNPSASIDTSGTGKLIVAAVANGATTWNPSGRTGVQLFDRDNGAWGGGSQYILSSASDPQTVSWTFATSDDWGLLAASFNEVAAATDRQGRVTWAELETGDAPRSGRVTWAELETANAPRSGRVTWAELETADAPRSGRITWAELETGDVPVSNDRSGRVTWAELETGDSPRSGRITWAELQTGDAPRSGRITWAEIETSDPPVSGRILWAEFEAPNVASPGQRKKHVCQTIRFRFQEQ